jgi:prepilin peptidase CpaA
MFVQTIGTAIAGVIYSIILAIAAVSDFRTRRIPNLLCLTLLLGGFAYSIATLGVARGIGFAIGGVLVGFVLWIPFYALQWLGAGDVKLIAAAGAWLGAMGALRASGIGAIVGGGISLMLMLWQRSPKTVALDVLLLFNTIRHRPSGLRIRMTSADVQLMPYGVALSIGALVAGWFVR